MKAMVINPADRSVAESEIDGLEKIKSIIGFDTIISDDIDDSGDRLYFDEECFLRGTEGRFQIDRLIPVSGIGVVIGSSADGSLADIATAVDALKDRVRFIN